MKNPVPAFFAPLFLLLAGGTLPAQSALPLLIEGGQGILPPRWGAVTSHAWADVNGDGLVDLVEATRNRLLLFLKEKTGTFRDVSGGNLPRIYYSWITSVAAGDVDGDGDTDLVVGVSDSAFVKGAPSVLLLNDGKGRFTDASSTNLPGDHDATKKVLLGDVDGDGDLDLVTINFGQNQLLLNDGKGKFTFGTKGRVPSMWAYSVTGYMADLDGDKDPDLLVETRSKGIHFFQNDGKGGFKDATAGRVPGSPGFMVRTADVDRDGDLDFMVVENSWLYLFRNDGKGMFTKTSTIVRFSRSVCNYGLDDVDGDGDPDVWEASSNLWRVEFYLNDATGRFSATPWKVSGFSGTWDTPSLFFRDVDGDKVPDLFLPARDGTVLLLGRGKGRFVPARRLLLPENALFYNFALGDMNGDGKVDLVLGDELGHGVIPGDGRGRFSGSFPSTARPTRQILLGDVDLDGDLDAFFLFNTGRVMLQVNDGKGRLSVRNLYPGVTMSRVRFSDIDGDGDPDLWAFVWGVGSVGRLALYLNRGKGPDLPVTSTQVSGALPTRITDLAVDDVDLDGDQDLVGSDWKSGLFLFRNNGRGIFTRDTSAWIQQGNFHCQTLLLRDVDGDGDPDLLAGNYWNSPEQNRLFLNDGKGKFTDATSGHLPARKEWTVTLAMGDLDGDGDPDLVVGNSFGFGQVWGPEAENRFLLNDGKGRFTDAPAGMFPATPTSSETIVLRDLDRDGDLDFMDGGYGGVHVFLNTLRQVHLPWVSFPGRPERADFYAWTPAANRARVVVPFLAPAPGMVFLAPFGFFGLAPGRTLPLAPLTIPAGRARTSLVFTLPADPALRGAPFYLQGLVLPGPKAPLSTWRFTNTWGDWVESL